jgi:hypothetical protein
VHTCAEFLDHLAIKCRKVVRFPAGNEAIINEDLLVTPVAAGIEDIGAD